MSSSTRIYLFEKSRRAAMPLFGIAAICFLFSIGCFAEEVTSQTGTQSSAPSAPQETAAQKAKRTEESCKRVFDRYAVPFQTLWSKRGPNVTIESTEGRAMLADMTAQHCTDSQSRKQFIAVISKLINVHSGQIGVILPLTAGQNIKHLMRGIENALRQQGLDPAKILLVFDNQGKPQVTEQILAQLIYRDHVSAVIGGFSAADATILRSWSDKIMLPAFILQEPEPGPLNSWTFYVKPSQQGLAKALVQANLKYGQKKISIMRPSDQHSDSIVNAYVSEAQKSGIEVLHNVVFDSKRIDQMESAARKLFQLDPGDRKEELQQIYEQTKRDAQRNGRPFNPRMVYLQPIVKQDAVFIADNFRVARHLAKVLTFLGVRKLSLFGSLEWRSPGIIESFDPLFNNAFFADFIGSYATLPDGIKVPTEGSPYFIPNDRVEEVDYAMLGYHAIDTPILLAKATTVPRRKLLSLIPRPDPNSPNKFFTFDASNVINWSTSIFRINQQGSSGVLSLETP